MSTYIEEPQTEPTSYLRQCRACYQPVSIKAPSCPHCGHAEGNLLDAVALLAGAAGVAIGVIGCFCVTSGVLSRSGLTCFQGLVLIALGGIAATTAGILSRR